ncbi:transcriptional regulator, LacI family [Cohaesibacter sp. ES.047]|uniref:substrate-binding domain-containing protein n=1 Tax=Cohaesibacter sp. ES.047 TaxID=1798205 RepID=UPI000BC0266D|nr:substrate-binding domain-containing protein [Cohaesibacter sp. ES.047]SNY92722.1 transcriptional regulator, LacI family [Cohaesibacter sp. ES.047]
MPKTISEIAAATGYSRTTITLVLKGQAKTYRISDQAQKTIEQYVADHGGYTINQTARNLKMKRSYTVGFVVPDLANTFFANLIAYLEVMCRAEDLVLITTSSGEDPDLELKAINSMLGRGVDGLIIAPCSQKSFTAGLKRAKKTPLVAIDRYYPDVSAPFISSNHSESARMITKRIAEHGCSRIALLCGHPENPSIEYRIAGFRETAREAGLSDEDAVVLSVSDDSIEAGKELGAMLLADNQELPPAILCSSLLVLEGVLDQLKSQLGQVPSDLVIGTFDYDGLLEFLPNLVFAIKQNEEGLAQSIFAQLKSQMDKLEMDIEPQIIDTRLVRLSSRSQHADAG